MTEGPLNDKHATQFVQCLSNMHYRPGHEHLAERYGGNGMQMAGIVRRGASECLANCDKN